MMAEKQTLTAEQKQAIAYENKKKQYKGNVMESYLFTQNPENFEKFQRLTTITEQMKELKAESDTLRTELLELMKKCKCNRVLDVVRRKQLTISQSRRNTKKVFDEERFKLENPEMYEKYRVSQSSYSSGGTLTLRAIEDTAMEFCDLEEFQEYLVK